MMMTEEGLDLIKQFEGFRSTAYRDPVGIWTIGYGHTTMAGAPEVKAGLTISRGEGADILARDVAHVADGVRKLLTVPLTPQQFSALVSFAYNVGLGGLAKSSVLAAVNRKDFEAVPRRLHLWSKAGGRVLPGLVRRRAAEAALFMSGVTAIKPAPVETIEAKPLRESKTIWSAVVVMIMAVAQIWLAATLKLAGLVLLFLIIAGLALIIYERVKKLKQEGV
jgi:lysozyme